MKIQQNYKITIRNTSLKNEWGQPPIDKEEYRQKAIDLLNSPVDRDIEGFVATKTSPSGYVFRYRNSTNEIAMARPDGTIEPLFRPREGKLYWLDEIKDWK